MKKVLLIIIGLATISITPISNACGGFFCELTPINQAAEQIIFRQDGNDITTMVQITYSGEAENFAWVLPVPQTPELSIGSDITFSELEGVTRPQFLLTRTGQACPIDSPEIIAFNDGATAVPTPIPTPDSVVIEQTLEVGPFDAQIISSDSSSALSIWLADNNFDLSDRGEELLEPYINANMKFVVLKLQSNKATGDIQPLILKYQGEKPMIPLRLTALAAQDDMGILVWVLGQNRAVPDNFLHVTPNYTRLNWYTGTRNAYASYQSLITEAMNEAGGQGFATDMAERITNLSESFTDSSQFTDILSNLENLNDAEFIQALWLTSFNSTIINAVTNALPLPDGQDSTVYTSVPALTTQYTAEQLTAARSQIIQTIQDQLIDPLDNSLDILDDDLYLTRLYTTLSADEMLTDPTFVFNPDMPDQSQQRNAILDAQCTDQGTQWTLRLGEGTGRDDTLVLNGSGPLPLSAQANEQEASWQIAKTSASGLPSIEQEREFPSVEPAQADTASSGGGSISYFMLVFLSAITFIRTRQIKNKATNKKMLLHRNNSLFN